MVIMVKMVINYFSIPDMVIRSRFSGMNFFNYSLVINGYKQKLPFILLF